MKRSRGMPALLVLALLAAAPLSCGKPEGKTEEGPKGRKIVKWARSADSTSLDPAEIEYGEDVKITQNIYETLVTYGPDSTDLVPGLAEKWETSADGKTWTFHLRKGVNFHDGTGLDAADVVFTFRRITDPRFEYAPKAIPYGSLYVDVESVKADGESRVVFTLKNQSGVFLNLMALFTAAIVSPEAVKAQREKFPEHPCGTGPYRLAAWDRKVKIVLERNPGYHGPAPAVEQVIVIPVEKPQEAIAKLRNGEVDVVDHPTLADAKAFKDKADIRFVQEASSTVCYLAFNLDQPPYSDRDFRRGVAMAIDRKTVSNLVYDDVGIPAHNLVPALIWGDAPAPPDFEYDPAKARELLSKARRGDAPVELWHMTFGRPYVPEPKLLAECLKEQFRQAGLDVKLVGFDKAAYTEKTKDPKHPMCLSGWIPDYFDADNFFYPLLHGESAGNLNIPNFKNAEFDAKVKAAQQETDPKKRKELYAAAARIVREEVPLVPLMYVPQLVALSPGVEYNPHPIECRFTNLRLK